MSEPTKEELLFGRIALHNKLIDQGQFDQVLARRRQRSDVNEDFGRLVKACGFIDDKQYRTIRKAQEKALLGKGFTIEQVRFLARGMTAEGNVPGGDGSERPQVTRALDKERARAAIAEEPAVDEPEEVVDEFVPDDEPPAAAPPSRPAVAAAAPAAAKPAVKRPQDAAARKTMLALFKKAREVGASDVHLSCGAKPFFRLSGQINYIDSMPVVTPEQGKLLAASVLSDEQWAKFVEKNDWDGSIDLGPQLGRYRANVLKQRRGVSSVYRVINSKIPTLESLGMPEVLERFTTFHQGLVLVTGSTGSGKSSTLAALIEMVNQSRKDHVITMEDPIEYVFQGKNCNVTQRQIDEHTRSWGNALRASLREDPDVIMVGEMRDLETVSLAITAAETGHLVFGTLHTTSATRTIDRLLDVFPPGEQSQIRAMVSESLKGIVSQQLIPKADGKGRVAAFEIMFWTPAVANLIRDGSTFKLQSVLQTGRKLGMILMDESIKQLLDQGLITKEAARFAASNPKLFQ